MVGPAVRGRQGAAIGNGGRRTNRVFEQKHRIIGRNRAAIIERDGGDIGAIAFQVNRPIPTALMVPVEAFVRLTALSPISVMRMALLPSTTQRSMSLPCRHLSNRYCLK